MDNYSPTANYIVIYVFAIHDENHRGILKIGKTSFDSLLSINQLPPNCEELNRAAKERIDEETKTALVPYELLHTELAVKDIVMADGTKQSQVFTDKAVHKVLYNSGFKSVKFMESGRESEWFYVDLKTAVSAIQAVKNGKNIVIIDNKEKNETDIKFEPIVLRKEQKENVEKTVNIFRNYDEMLWNCKMRYGKTVTAYELIKRQGYQKVIVVTHRPAVEDSWKTDHENIFYGTNHRFEVKKQGKNIDFDSVIDRENEKVLSELADSGVPFTYFASIQDLRGSQRVGGKYNKNNFIFDLKWDLIIIDEAHEGTQTELGDAVIKELRKKGTKVLMLSGTPYNIINGFDENVYTWTYVDEQIAKANWEKEHPNEENPYAVLPKMNIMTFDLSENISTSYRYVTEDSAFNFREFFRVWTGDLEKDFRPVPVGAKNGDFIHERDVKAFLDLITTKSEKTNYPFATDEYRDMFRHTFWLVPSVKEAKALSKLLKEHPVFRNFSVANIAGDGDEEQAYDEALKLVKENISNNPYTITLSCGRLTTGVTVKEWTAIMMLAGSYSTSASGYMQSIFRVQSPGCINGKQKENCYVFDFAPDRALKVVASVHNLSVKGMTSDDTAKAKLGEFLNFCPIISVEGTEMRTYSVDEMMRKVKSISVEHAINSGFEDDTIYNRDIGINMSESDVEIIRHLSDVVTPQKKGKKQTEVIINNKGMTNEEYRQAEKLKKKPKRERTPEDEELLKKMKELNEQQKKIRNLLRAVSIRLPLLFYGADFDINETVHLKDFVNSIVDEESWKEFMPKGLSTKLFLQILKYYDEDVLVEAGMRIRKMAKAADELLPTLRAKRIVEIISKFKNPDKETVLTPWRVVNMHLGEAIGGYNFFDEKYEKEIEEPRLIEQGDVTADILLNTNAKILEMNSKSGLYPLYMAYSLYTMKVSGKEKDLTFEEAQRLWNETLENNIFVLCKTKMARKITIRTLAGYSKNKVNAIYLTKLLERMQDKERFKNKLTNPQTWEKEGERMKFDAVVGNPPYQEENENTRKPPIYHYFYDSAFELSKIVSFISPARFLFNAGQTPQAWNEKMLNDKYFKVVKYFENSKEVFETVDIKGGVAITIRNLNVNYGKIKVFATYSEQRSIMKKIGIELENFHSLTEIISSRGHYRFTKEFFVDFPYASEILGKGTGNMIASNSLELLPEVFFEDCEDLECLKFIGRVDNKRVNRFILKKYIQANDFIETYNVILPKSNGSGLYGERLSSPVVIEPNNCTTDTFISIGKFENKSEADALLKYIKSKFLRAILGIKKVTQDNPASVWAYVPLQDFTEKSDIDWSKSVSEIDKQLYKKYNLSEEEITFIETKVSPME